MLAHRQVVVGDEATHGVLRSLTHCRLPEEEIMKFFVEIIFIYNPEPLLFQYIINFMR